MDPEQSRPPRATVIRASRSAARSPSAACRADPRTNPSTTPVPTTRMEHLVGTVELMLEVARERLDAPLVLMAPYEQQNARGEPARPRVHPGSGSGRP